MQRVNTPRGYDLFLKQRERANSTGWRGCLGGLVLGLWAIMMAHNVSSAAPLTPSVAVHYLQDKKVDAKADHYGIVKGQLPLGGDAEQGAFSFLDLRLKSSVKGIEELNFGISKRQKGPGDHWWGAYAFYDSMRYTEQESFRQITLGGELLHPRFITRANVYWPLSKPIYTHGGYGLGTQKGYLVYEEVGRKADHGFEWEMGPRWTFGRQVLSLTGGVGVWDRPWAQDRLKLRAGVTWVQAASDAIPEMEWGLHVSSGNTGSYAFQLGVGMRFYQHKSLGKRQALDVAFTPIVRDVHILTSEVRKYSDVYPILEEIPGLDALMTVDDTVGPERSPEVEEGLVPPTHQFMASISFPYLTDKPRIFTHPLGVKFQEHGLSLGRTREVLGHTGPSGEVTAAIANTLLEDVVLVSDTMLTPKVRAYGEFSVDVGFKDPKAPTITLAHGSPYVFVQNPHQASLKLTFAEDAVMENLGDARFKVVHVAGGDRRYLVASTQALAKTSQQDKSMDLSGHSFSIAALPAKKQLEVDAKFMEHAFNRITHSSTQFSGGETSFNVATQHLETGRKGGDTLLCVYPHQASGLIDSRKSLDGVFFPSIRGDMQVLEGSGFKTYHKTPQALPYFPGKGLSDAQKKTLTDLLDAEVKRYQQRIAEGKPPLTDAQDTYWVGKALHVISEQVHIAESLKNEEAKSALLDVSKMTLEAWFKGEGTQKFVYNPKWGVVLGVPASFGTDKELNDLHFHLGYFIEAAATVRMYDQRWGARWERQVDPLVHSLINYDASPYFMQTPHRVFRPYAGFSQASGHASFGDGGNHESSSEAMNAWSGMLLWANLSDNSALRKRAAQAFVTEAEAIWAYYFYHEPSQPAFVNIHPEYGKPVVGMVWDNKVDFATWFSASPEHILGIQLLPMSARSLYLARYPGFIQSPGIKSISENAAQWGDLHAMYLTLGDGQLREYQGTFEEGNSQLAYQYHQLSLDSLGVLDAQVTSDADFSAVFADHFSNKTYVAYNPTSQPLDVHFSDGHVLYQIPAYSQKAGS